MVKTPYQGTSSPGMGDSRGSADSGPPAAGGTGGKSRSEGDMLSRASETLHDAAEQQKAAGANFMGDMAGAVRRAAGEFEGRVPQAAEYIRYAADQMDNMSDAVRRRDVGQIVSDLRGFARRQPTAFLGATFLAGFAAVRFLKSSSSESTSSRAAGRSPDPSSGMARSDAFGEPSPHPTIPPSNLRGENVRTPR